MENAIGHIKRRLDQRTGSQPALCRMLATFLELVTHEFNHKANRLLAGKTPWQVWNGERIRFSRRERREIFRLLYEDFSRMIGTRSTLNHRVFGAAWRQTVESWLRRQGLIRVDEPLTQHKSVNHFSAHFGLKNLKSAQGSVFHSSQGNCWKLAEAANAASPTCGSLKS